jgi:VWFA-related protein
MIRIAILIASLATAGLAAVRAQAPAEPRPGQLVIDAVAVDRKGSPISDLRRDEVEVWINHYRIPIESFIRVTPDDEPIARSIVLLLDDITLDPAVVQRAREAAKQFVEQMSPGDRIAIVTLNGPLIESTNDRARLLRSLDTYNQRASGMMTREMLGARVLTTIESASRQFGEGTVHRRTIVAIGSAWLFDTPIPISGMGGDLRQEWTSAMRAMASAKVTLYVIEPRGIGMVPLYGGESGFARETGGYAFTSSNDLKAVATRILREAWTYYLIGVADPAVGRTADLRELDVRVLRKGISVRARRRIPGRS